jgi:hypothetical protein
MSYAMVFLMGWSVAQPPSASPGEDYIPINSRTLKLPIKYEKDRRHIRQMKLFVARNGENTWYQEAAVAPDQDHFTFHAKDDGLYWFIMVEEDLQGRQVPADLTRTPPDLKVLIDTTPPRIRLTTLQRQGEEIVAEWVIEDAYPAAAKTQVHVRPAGSSGEWQEVRLAPGVYHGVRFPLRTPQAVELRVTAYDLAGNKGETVQVVPAAEGLRAGAATASGVSAGTGPIAPASSTGLPVPELGAIPPPAPLAPAAPSGPLVPGPGTPPSLPAPALPAAPPLPPTGSLPAPPAASPLSPAPPLAPGAVASSTPATAPAGERPLPTVESRPAPAAPLASSASPLPNAPVPTWSSPTAAGPPQVEETRATVINYLAFDLAYEVEARGPSGLSRLDLWVTRDDGRTWMKWSQHEPHGATVRVNLNLPSNPQPEGSYGFRIVPVSGAGLSEREPVSGDAPDLRVIVDVTPPQVEVYPPVGDPQQPHTLLLQWKAVDKHWGAHPILLQWSDKPNGPWQPVVTSTSEVQQAAASASASSAAGQWIANTGTYAWRVPAGLPPRVYLKVTARDAAGNIREVVTRDPILVDLVKPKARISGIVGPALPAVSGQTPP